MENEKKDDDLKIELIGDTVYGFHAMNDEQIEAFKRYIAFKNEIESTTNKTGETEN